MIGSPSTQSEVIPLVGTTHARRGSADSTSAEPIQHMPGHLDHPTADADYSNDVLSDPAGVNVKFSLIKSPTTSSWTAWSSAGNPADGDPSFDDSGDIIAPSLWNHISAGTQQLPSHTPEEADSISSTSAYREELASTCGEPIIHIGDIYHDLKLQRSFRYASCPGHELALIFLTALDPAMTMSCSLVATVRRTL